jgi:DNA processing protein
VAAGVDGGPNPAGSARTALEAVDYHPTTLDEVARRSGLPPAELAALMLELELAGWVESVAGAFQRCR